MTSAFSTPHRLPLCTYCDDATCVDHLWVMNRRTKISRCCYCCFPACSDDDARSLASSPRRPCIGGSFSCDRPKTSRRCSNLTSRSEMLLHLVHACYGSRLSLRWVGGSGHLLRSCISLNQLGVSCDNHLLKRVVDI